MAVNLSEPVVLAAILAACGTVIAALIGGYAALRAKIQQDAWRLAFEQKRSDIQAFHDVLNRFGDIVNALGEIRGTSGPFGFHVNCFQMWTEQLWPSGPRRQRMDAVLDHVLRGIPFVPPTSTSAALTPQEEAAVQQLRNAFGNEVTVEALALAHHLSTLQNRLGLTVRFPNVISHGVAAMMEEFGALVGVGPHEGISNFEFAGFAKRYAANLRGCRLALRRELRASARSLRAAYKVSTLHRIGNFVRQPRRSIKTWWTTYYTVPPMFRSKER